MTRLQSVYSDINALGSSVPIRAAYEVSKRSGLHSVVFGMKRSAPKMRSKTLQIGNLAPNTTEARDRALEDAKVILADGLRVFGRRVSNGISAQWSHDPDDGKNWPASTPWWKIDIRTEQRLGDVKYVWEAARHRDLVVLARATRLEPDGPWAVALDSLLLSWCEQNRPERSVNWYSSLELSLRAIAWCQVLALAGERLSPTTRALMDEQLMASAHHLMVELPYTLSSMKNNHMLGDALGLIVLSRMFPQHHPAQRWARFGERLFAAQLGRHMHPDGSMIEDSLSYHRFVLEMLIVRLLIGDAPDDVLTAVRGASHHLAAIGIFDGEVPQHGDWDEGRVLASSGNPLDVAGSAMLGLALAGEAVPEELADECDELAWYASPPAVTCPEAAKPSPQRPVTVSGGIAYAQRGPWRVWFKVGAGKSHGHADLTSVWVQHEGRWLIADPGTGTYNGQLSVRNAFRTSSAHPVLRVDGHDQLGPHRAFRWMHSAQGYLAPPIEVDNVTILFGWHDAYERLEPGVRVGRAVLLTDSYIAVVEFVPTRDKRQLQMTIPLATGVKVRNGKLIAGDVSVGLFGCDEAQQAEGVSEPFRGWASATYGSWQPAIWLDCSPADVWGLGEQPTIRPHSGNGTAVESLQLRVRWTPNAAELEVFNAQDGKLTVTRT
jgi:hypothetical protein